MTTPDHTLATRLATARMRYNATETGYANDELRMIAGDAYRSGQLITLADAEAMVRAENQACAMVAQPNGFQPECCRDTMLAIASAIRARVKP